ncbi:MAG: GldG family protein, partial [Deltaproteobacteria bacterium]|nr:GldG family protein [Deltaproteobacteria bacterium]
MKRKFIGRILGVIGLVLLLSSVLTWLIGLPEVAAAKVALALLLFVAYVVTNFGDLGKAASSRGTFFFGVTSISTVVVVALLASANYVAAKNPQTWDLTKNQIHTLSPDTVKTLEGLKTDVTATAFYGSAEPQFAALQDLFKRYQAKSEHFKFDFADPIKDPLKRQQFNVRNDGPRVVVKLGETESRFQEINEEALTNAIVKVTHSATKKIYFTTGHGEADPDDAQDTGLANVKKRMENEGLKAEKLNFASTPEVPADAQVVVVAGPAKAFQPGEVDALGKFLDAGGKAFLMLEPQVDSGLDGLLKAYNVEADRSLVVDPVSRLFGASEVVPVVQNYSTESDITRDFKLNTVFPTARPLTVLRDASSPAVAKPVALSMPSAWGEANPTGEKVQRDDEEKGGPFPLVVQVTKETKSVEQGGRRSDQARLVVAGDRDFATNKFHSAFGNEDLFLNCLSWLSDQTERITIRPRLRDASRLYLTPTQQATIFFLAIDVLPVTLLAAG